MSNNTVSLYGKKFEIIEAKEYITLADSFVKNKIGTGHGEAKLYIGNDNEETMSFFDDFDRPCFFRKSDFIRYLSEARAEFLHPQQAYINKNDFPNRFSQLLTEVEALEHERLNFNILRVNVNPPRVYIKSTSENYELMRKLALPNISYLSVLKIKDDKDNICYYFRIFIDYFGDERVKSLEDDIEVTRLNNNPKLTDKKREILIKARAGQGEYRKKLLEECPFCPITGVNDERFLIASHIKPWAKCDDKEKLDPKNGLIFTPTYDKLFDKGFITFEDDGTMVVSPWLSPMNQKRLKVFTGRVIKNMPLDGKRRRYLKYHRENIFKQ